MPPSGFDGDHGRYRTGRSLAEQPHAERKPVVLIEAPETQAEAVLVPAVAVDVLNSASGSTRRTVHRKSCSASR